MTTIFKQFMTLVLAILWLFVGAGISGLKKLITDISNLIKRLYSDR